MIIGKQINDWKCRTFLFLLSQEITFFGSLLVQFAIIWYIAKTTTSGRMVSLSMICSFLPQLLISAFAGVWADRYTRKTMIPQLVPKEKLMRINGLHGSFSASISFAAPIAGGAILSVAPLFFILMIAVLRKSERQMQYQECDINTELVRVSD